MNASRCTPALAILCSLLFVPSVFGQVKSTPQAPAAKAAPTTGIPAPATPAKWLKPVKGTAYIEVIRGVPKRVGADIVTVLKIRNTSTGAISLLKVDEYWYDKKMRIVTGDSQPYRKPFNAGDVIEITMKSPSKPDLYQNQHAFSHANGAISAKAVKKFE
jgi:hypothetical protein